MIGGAGAKERRAPAICSEAPACRKPWLIYSDLEGHPREHLIMFSPLEGHPRGNFITFSPMEGHPRGHFHCDFSNSTDSTSTKNQSFYHQNLSLGISYCEKLLIRPLGLVHQRYKHAQTIQGWRFKPMRLKLLPYFKFVTMMKCLFVWNMFSAVKTINRHDHISIHCLPRRVCVFHLFKQPKCSLMHMCGGSGLTRKCVFCTKKCF